MLVRAYCKALGFSPRKARLVVDLVRGKPVDEALAVLSFTPTPIARSIAKVLRSAAANAENNYQLNPRGLKVAQIMADEGPRLKRFRPQARGRVNPIQRRSCHITVIVEGESGE